jgi:hypothetical protein
MSESGGVRNAEVASEGARTSGLPSVGTSRPLHLLWTIWTCIHMTFDP